MSGTEKERNSGWKERLRENAAVRACRRADAFCAEHRLYVLLLCFALMILTTALKYVVYTPEGFRDGMNITALANGGSLEGYEEALVATVTVFRLVTRLTGPMSLQAWSWLLLIPGMAVFAAVVWNARPKNLASVLVLMGFSVFLPFYVFMPGVDMLQYLVFGLVSLVLFAVPGQAAKAAGSALLLLPVALFLRDYYFLMILFIGIVFVFAILYRRKKSIPEQSLFLICTAIVVIFAIYLMRLFAPESLDTLFTVRTMMNRGAGSAPAPDKLIYDFLPLERSVPGFLANYIFAAVRILFPLELCANISDAPFAVFQVLLTVLLISELVKSRRVRGRTAVYTVIIAFLLMSFFFEPDFGSWFRHEAAAFPVIWMGIGFDRDGDAPGRKEQQDV